MKEFDPLAGAYPELKRKANRTIVNRIKASYRDKEFYDGDRANGYGGYVDDGRWVEVAKNLARVYNLQPDSSVLQIGCHKGFLLNAFADLGYCVRGTEVSDYAIENVPYGIKPFVKKSPFTELPFGDHEFDLVLAMSTVYVLNLPDAIKCLREIGRVGKGQSFITLGAYETHEDFWLFQKWLLLGCTILNKSEWREVLTHAGFQGDYRFDTARTLNLE